MAALEHQPATDPTIVWHPMCTVPDEHALAWIRWHDNSEGVTSLAVGRDASWWSRHGATHWRLVTKAEATAYSMSGR